MSYYVRSRLDKIKSEIDEVKFLLSNSYRLFLQKIVHGVTGRYDLKVIFSKRVYTDNEVIAVNPVHKYVMKIKRLAKKTLVILGQLAHEIFHIIYTDFSTLKRVMEEYEKKLDAFRLMELHNSLNVIEDSAIELAGTNYYTGSFRQAIIALNENALENMPSLDEMAEQGAPRLAIFKQACAMYCILGTLKGELHDSELIEMFEKAMPILDKGRLEPNTEGRFKAAEKLYRLMEPLIKEAEERGEKMRATEEFQYVKNKEISSGGSSSEVIEVPDIKRDFSEENREEIKKIIKKMKEKSTLEETKTMPGSDKTLDEDSLGTDEGVDGKESEEKPSSGADDFEDGCDSKKAEGGDADDEESADGTLEGNDEKDGEKESSTKDSSTEGLEEKKHKREDEDTDEKRELEELLESFEEQLEDAFEEVAKEEYDKEEQREQDRKIHEFARSVKFSEIHKHIQPRAIRDFEVDEYVINKYNEIFKPIKGLSRSLTKKLKNIIKYNEELKLTGLSSGKINPNQLYRQDKLVFYKRRGKSDEADLAIVLLVDESGSMCWGRRFRYAQQAAMLLYEVCAALKIPLAVIGFDAAHGGDEVRHRHYVDFNSRDKREKYKLAYIDYHYENRDGYSIKYAGEYLARRPEEDKILIVISDGAPAHPSRRDSYSGSLGIQDSGRAVKELERKGIKVFGLAIGDGKTQIKKIYTRNYIDIPDLKYLPGRLVNLIERNLLK